MTGPYSLGFCKWDIPALCLVIAAAVLIAVHNHRYKKEAEEYRQALDLADSLEN